MPEQWPAYFAARTAAQAQAAGGSASAADDICIARSVLIGDGGKLGRVVHPWDSELV